MKAFGKQRDESGCYEVYSIARSSFNSRYALTINLLHYTATKTCKTHQLTRTEHLPQNNTTSYLPSNFIQLSCSTAVTTMMKSMILLIATVTTVTAFEHYLQLSIISPTNTDTTHGPVVPITVETKFANTMTNPMNSVVTVQHPQNTPPPLASISLQMCIHTSIEKTIARCLPTKLTDEITNVGSLWQPAFDVEHVIFVYLRPYNDIELEFPFNPEIYDDR